jgi:N-acyl-D-amino-acid deacylase
MEFDVLIRNGEVIDGSQTGVRRRYDVGITGDRVTAIGALADSSAATEIDAAGGIVAPGFIDVHIHSEIELLGGPHRYAGLLQGVTTQLLAPDGFGWAPLSADEARSLWEATVAIYGPLELEPGWDSPDDYLALFEGNTPANVMPQVPHTAVRLKSMGWDARPATDDELEVMRGLVRRWMEAGATCLCLGLDYQPSAFSDTRELIELSKVAREYDGIYTAHVRYNTVGLEAAWRETMEIGKEAGIPVHISHEWVRDVTAGLLDEAEEICDLTFESYLYPAGCTHLLNLMPMPYQAGGPDGVRARLSTEEGRAAISSAIADRLRRDYEQGSRAIFANTRSGRWVGQDMVSAAEGEDMPLEAFVLEVFDVEYPEGLMVYRRGDTPEQIDAWVARTFSHPRMMVASDGIYYGPHAHPRGYGCFARALRKGVRELRAVSLEEAIWKMSGFPAERFRIPERGELREGYFADVVVFDPETIADRSTWDEPRLHPVGIDRVLVNGEVVVAGGTPSGALPGRVVRGSQA